MTMNEHKEARDEEFDEDDFRSCCEDEDELKEKEEMKKDNNHNVEIDDYLHENAVKMYFKGVSVICSDSRLSGIGVVMERSSTSSLIQVQKKLDFYVDELVADYLALLDGLSEAIRNNVTQVFAFTDSEVLYDQITHSGDLENPLIGALRQRILEQAGNIETFVLKLVPTVDLETAMHLAKVAIGIVSSVPDQDSQTETCPVCHNDKLASMMMTIKCTHKICSHCIKTHVEEKAGSAELPVRCPRPGCKYVLSASECSSFLPVASYESLQSAMAEANIANLAKMCCPYPNCTVRFNPRECFLAGSSSSSSSLSDDSCLECPACRRFICLDCGIPWHPSTNCDKHQNRDFAFMRMMRNNRWRHCPQCERAIERTNGCNHMSCWCGHGFCYACGAAYEDAQPTCQCAVAEYDYSDHLDNYPNRQFEQWAWESFESPPVMNDDAYTDQERSQLAVIQRFLSGNFDLTDNDSSRSPPRSTESYADAMKDLSQLPWLERFVSVISDDYYEDYA